MSIEVPFYEPIPPGLPDEALRRNIIIRKVLILQVASNLLDPCIGSSLSIHGWVRLRLRGAETSFTG